LIGITRYGADDKDARADILSYEDEIHGGIGTKMIISLRVSQTVKGDALGEPENQ
jgi:hypothetical protein